MKTRITTIFSALLICALISACGPSADEQAATATQGAANIFATLTAQAPTATPTFTPSPTSTATPTATPTPSSTPTPRPTNTPEPSPTPTPGLSSLALTLDDLPAGFEAIPAGQVREMKDAYPEGSDAYGFQDSKGDQIVMGILIPYKSRADQAVFDLMLPDFVKLMATATGADTNTKELDGLDDIGEARAGITAVSQAFGNPMRWDIVAFRRGQVGALLYAVYPDGDEPSVPILELTRLQEERIQNYLTAGSSASGDRETIKVGLLAPLSGQVPTFGLSVLEGVQLAVKEWNAKGGLLGKQIELIVADSQCSAEPAVKAANKLIDQDDVKFIIGEVCSSASIPVSEIVNKTKVLQISPTSTNLAVTVDGNGNTKPFTFRACFIDPYQGWVMAKFATGRGYKTAFIMYDPGNDYPRGLAERFEESFTEMGGQIVGKATYASTDTDFTDILSMVAESNPDVLYLPDYYNIVNLVGAQAKEKGVTAVMMGGDGWDSADLDVNAAEGGFYSNHYDPGDTRPIVVDWLKAYGAEYKDANGQPKVPDALATLAYDAANLLFAAIEEAGTEDTTKVAEAMAAITWEAVSGKITFDAQHNPIKNAVVIGIAGGKKSFVESIAP